MSQRIALFLSALITALILAVTSIVGDGITALAALYPPPSTTRSTTTVNTIAQSSDNVASRASADNKLDVRLSSGQAAKVALQLVPNAAVQGTPELVDFQGKVAYEVLLDQGVIYVDANKGTVLSNSITQSTGPVNLDQAIQIAQNYLQQNHNSAQLMGVRSGRARGMQLFEVTFDDGSQIYVNADTGEVAIVRIPRG